MIGRNKASGFTLVELLVVIAIIGILATILVPVIGDMMERGSIAVQAGEFSNMQMALSNYIDTFQTYPPSTDGAATNSQCLVRYLDGDPANGGPTGDPLFTFKKDKLDTATPPNWLDAWGQPISYLVPGVKNPKSYDMWSWGPDGVDNAGAAGSDDIGNW
jgi:general secretion pathway protein G